MNDSTEVVLFGTGRVGEVVHHYLDSDPAYEVAAFTADAEYVTDDELLATRVVPFEEVAEKFPPDRYKMFTAIAYSDRNQLRRQKYREGKEKGYDFITYVDPAATVADNAELGENCFVFEENVIQPFVTIGDNVILWSGNHIGHHSTIERDCFVSSHVVVSGNVEIGEQCFLGVNATLVDGIEVGERAVIGAGALLVDDATAGAVYGGEPATVLEAGETDEDP